LFIEESWWLRINKKLKIAIVLAAVLGIAFIAYPFMGNVIFTINQYQVISNYNEKMATLNKTDIEDFFLKAKEHNDSLIGGGLKDPFSDSSQDKEATQNSDADILPEDDGVIGYVEIPAINLYTAIYNKTTELNLQKGTVHLNGSSLPVGGAGSHSVITGHSGLPDRLIFTDLEKLTTNDRFFIHILGKTLKYKINRIKTVLPNDVSEIRPVAGQDYVTLITCTPYAVNTHRLLVRGVRVEEKETSANLASKDIAEDEENIYTEPGFYNMILGNKNLLITIIISAGILLIILAFAVFKIAKKLKRKHNNNANKT
jgi:sortase A